MLGYDDRPRVAVRAAQLAEGLSREQRFLMTGACRRLAAVEQACAPTARYSPSFLRA